MQPNQFDKSGKCLEAGNLAEEEFIRLAKLKEWTVSKSSNYEDINEHWDYKIENKENVFLIEVKAMKKLSRSDEQAQDNWIWLELHGVRDKGWINGGKADLIAFEKSNSFVFADRIELIKLLPELIKKDEFVTSPYEAKYKLYQRTGRKDILTLVELNKLLPIIKFEWNKS